jgi:hypothetical protein
MSEIQTSETQASSKYTNCKGITVSGNFCKTYKINDKGFCHIHEYMENYTEDMMSKLQICKGCKRKVYLSDNFSSCERCVNRGKETREKMKEKNNIPENRCLAPDCKYKKSENGYCGIHKMNYFLENAKLQGKKCCNRYNHGCRNLLELDYEFSSCENCRIKERVNDKKIRMNKKIIIENTKTKYEKQCMECDNVFPVEQYISNGVERFRCDACREKGKMYDQRRDKEHRREMGRIYDLNPRRREMKKEWIQKNYEKVTEINIRSRLKRRKENILEYLQKQAQYAKNWRKKHPEKVEEYNKFKRNSIKHCYMSYKRSAIDKNLEVDDLLNQYQTFEEFVLRNCYYCGSIQSKGFNGIDRKDSTNGYISSNCVTCCEKCNFIKGSLDPLTFYRRVCHLVSVNEWIPDVDLFFHDYFPNRMASSFTEYMKRANTKNLEFSITPEKYEEITHSPCYLCGKEASDIHLNGMDRLDNKVGYIEENVLPCCSECNYMKNEFTIEEFIEHTVQIYEFITSKQELYFSENIDIPEYINVLHRCHLNKKTSGEKQDEHQDKLSQTTEKYTDEYIQIHIQDLSEKRLSDF